MPAKKAAKKAAAKKGASAKDSPVAGSEVTEVKGGPARKVAKKAAKATKSGTTPKLDAKPPRGPEEIATAAYLNYMDRLAKGLPGDQDGDWHAAVNSRES